MARGPKKHLKRLAAPKSWMLDKLGGVFAPRPSPGPHKLRESLPLIIMLRNRLKYAITRVEAEKILKQRVIKVDGKVRTDMTFPAGFMDVVAIERTDEYFRILYDVKGRFILHRITAAEATYKLCRVKRVGTGTKGVPYLVTHDGRTIRYPDPLIKVHDTIRLDIASGKILEFIKFETGNLCMVTGGHNLGRIGVITNRKRHPGGFDIVHVKDSQGHTFATSRMIAQISLADDIKTVYRNLLRKDSNLKYIHTLITANRINYIFMIGKSTKPYISLPKGKGVRLSVADERDRRIAKQSK